MTMGTAMYTDAWSSHGRPLTADDSGATAAAAGVDAGDTTPSGDTMSTESLSESKPADGSLGAMISHWAEAAFGPAITSVGRELGSMAKELTAPGQIKRPWVWIGAAGVVGYALGRANALRPIASFATRTAFSTLVERALRG
jgi:hypothetical protein